MNPQPKIAYTETAVRGATPVGLIVMLHDAALKSLREARTAIAAGNVEARTRALNHVLVIVAELQGSLNFEKGGESAQYLRRFYEVVRAKVLEASIKSSSEIVEMLADQFTQQRAAWRQVDAAELRPAGTAVVAMLPVPAAHAPTPEPVAVGSGARWSA